MREESIFAQVLLMPESERGAFLNRVCEDDAELRRQV